MKTGITLFLIGVVVSCCQNKTSAEHITHIIEPMSYSVTYVNK